MEAAEVEEKILVDAEKYGCKIHQSTGESDFFFAYIKEIYRFVDGAVKKICTVDPRLIEIVNKGSSTSQKNHYLFEVHSSKLKNPVEILMPARVLASRRAFSIMLLSKIPWGHFEGNKSDFGRFLSYVLEEHSFRARGT
ncbi:TPA: hypothetical protein ACKAEQ_000852 [Pseudomonas aeruginosa]